MCEVGEGGRKCEDGMKAAGGEGRERRGEGKGEGGGKTGEGGRGIKAGSAHGWGG